MKRETTLLVFKEGYTAVQKKKKLRRKIKKENSIK